MYLKYSKFLLVTFSIVSFSGCCRQVNWHRLDSIQSLADSGERTKYQTLVQYLGIPALIYQVDEVSNDPKAPNWAFCYLPEQKKKTSQLRQAVLSDAQVRDFVTKFEQQQSTLPLKSELTIEQKAKLYKGEYYLIDEAGTLTAGCFCGAYFNEEDYAAHRLTKKDIELLKEGE